jgi:hypothetical protein
MEKEKKQSPEDFIESPIVYGEDSEVEGVEIEKEIDELNSEGKEK